MALEGFLCGVRIKRPAVPGEASTGSLSSGLISTAPGTVKRGHDEGVQEQAHTNGSNPLGHLLKRGYYGTYHKMSERHLARYIGEFAGRHNARAADTIQQMAIMAQGMMGKTLPYQGLIADP